MKRDKLLLIGLDGGTWKLLKIWIDDGSLPNLAELYSKGARGTLLSTVPSMTCPAVPSLFTGYNPGNTGIFDFVDPYGTPVRLYNIPGRKIWNVVQDHGMSSLLVDLRFVYPTEPLDGIMISNVPMPKEVDSAYYPPDLEEKLGRKITLVPLFRRHLEYAGNIDGSKEEYLASLRDYAEERYSLIKELGSQRDYDLIFTWFGDVDSVSHVYWYDTKTIQKHLRLVDEHIGRLMRDFPDRNIIILSDHGFHKEASLRFLINMWLEQEGVLETRGGALRRWLYKVVVSAATKFVSKNALLRLLGRKQKIHEGQEGDRIVLGDNYRNILPGVNWSKTKAYYRKPWGIQIIREHLDQDYDAFRRDIMDKMKQWRDPEGRRVFAHVWRREDIFTGKYLSQIPDIIYQMHEEYHPEYIITSGPLVQPDVRLLKGTGVIERTGNHVMDREGIFIGHGPGFQKGKDIGTANIEDIAPTIYHLLGCAIPDDIDGKIIMEGLSDELKEKEPKYYKPEAPDKPDERVRTSPEEDESIRQQLRDMGYLTD
jgi:predicted AlkP superfamily phosphohydrolase/phosphomutase